MRLTFVVFSLNRRVFFSCRVGWSIRTCAKKPCWLGPFDLLEPTPRLGGVNFISDFQSSNVSAHRYSIVPGDPSV